MKITYNWQPLEKPLSVFTVRNAIMKNLNTGEIVQHYSANTKLVMYEKCVTEIGTFYRTFTAAHHYLNYAFEASALGLPNEFAPSAPTQQVFSKHSTSSGSKKPKAKQTDTPKVKAPNDGGEPKPSFWKRLFGKKA